MSTAAALDPSRALTQYRLDRWTPRTGLPVTSVLCLLQDRAGYLWIGTQEGLSRLDGERLAPVPDRDGHPVGRLGALVRGEDGEIWGGGQGSLFRFSHVEAVCPRGVASHGRRGPRGEPDLA